MYRGRVPSFSIYVHRFFLTGNWQFSQHDPVIKYTKQEPQQYVIKHVNSYQTQTCKIDDNAQNSFAFQIKLKSEAIKVNFETSQSLNIGFSAKMTLLDIIHEVEHSSFHMITPSIKSYNFFSSYFFFWKLP
jgi:hypothetical protein